MFSSYPKKSEAVAPCRSVFVVDTQATRPPVPPRLNRDGRRGGAAQTLLFLLVSLALFGIIIEACFIYRLYQTETTVSSGSSSMLTGDENALPSVVPGEDPPPSKPVAHLTDGMDVAHDKHVMAWSMNAEPLLYQMEYRDRQLIIKKQGYYYIYSKVFFSDTGTFYHLINLQTEKYAGGYITLLQSRKYSPHTQSKSNSFLGGVFHLYENDGIYVNVSSTEKISRHKPYENVFGAYMI